MSKDARALRDEAAEATASGKYKRALAAYLELERLEPRDAQWAKRAGETYRRLGNPKLAIEAFSRSAERYAQNGFLVQAIAVCKLVLQIDPQHVDTLRRLSTMNEQIGQGPTRAGGMAENNPGLHENPNVAAIRRASAAPGPAAGVAPGGSGALPAQSAPTGASAVPAPVTAAGTGAMQAEPTVRPRRGTEPLDRFRIRPPTMPPAVSRTKSRPIVVNPGAALETVQLSKQVPESHPRDESSPGIHVIPIDDDPLDLEHTPGLLIEIEPPDTSPLDAELDDMTVLELADVEEIPLPAPRAIGQAGRQALAATPLFAGLPSEVLEALVEHLELLSLAAGEPLFHEGEPGDALYVIVEGEVSVQTKGPPAKEISRLGPGAFLGEVALLTDQPRAATVAALTAAELLRIDRITLSSVLGEHGDLLRAVLRFVRDRLVDRWMRTSPLFRQFDDAERADLAGQFAFLEIDAGTLLIGTGMRPDGLYIVLAGEFVVHRAGRAIATLGPGSLIGETALLAGGAFRSNVVAQGKSLALCLPASVFHEVIVTHPHVLEYVGEQAEHSRRLHIL